ncbi:MAG: ATP-binding protein [Acidimicrobiia bacterium]|nr:ATP-binding protein [Acidimicrobiia bacterium]MYC57837.1 ATP-binding protein [Acidimicrobiia bacterium]MYG94738.1 ATP-binding protein [Acidimicrobiia bacterium]MYI30639.1 ATP-binding protein [Acidimicrobiia bacterium]
MSAYRKRLVDPLVAEYLAELPAVSIVGPRASGKTTTAARHCRTVIHLDRPAESAAVAADPDAALAGLSEPILLDEWQEVPQVLGAVKRACDAEPRPGRFVLTGSVRAEIDAETWSAIGRVTRISMFPMTVGELLGQLTEPLIDRIVRGEVGSFPAADANLQDYLDMAVQGGFPYAVMTLGNRARRGWLDTYVEEIVTRDSALVGGGYDPTRLARYFEAYVLNSAGIVDDATLYSIAGIDRRTALGYRELLERLYVVDELPAWTSNRLKRLSLSPKRFLIDSSLLAAVTGASSQTAMKDGTLLGRLLETFVVAQLRAQAAVSEHRCRLFHLRQHHGRYEIDVVAEINAQQIIGIEIKATAAPSKDDARHLKWLRDQIGERFVAGVVLHTGPASFSLGTRLWALPISTLWS